MGNLVVREDLIICEEIPCWERIVSSLVAFGEWFLPTALFEALQLE